AAGSGEGARLPVVEPLRGKREIGRRLRLQRDPATRPEQLLRFGTGRRETLPHVKRILGVRNAMDRTAEEQAVAPVNRVLASLDTDRHVADVEVSEGERVEPFTRNALGVALCVLAHP